MSLSHSESETGKKTRSSDTMNVESNMSHILVGRSSPPPNPDQEMGQTSELTCSQGGSPMPRNSKEGQIMPGPRYLLPRPPCIPGSESLAGGPEQLAPNVGPRRRCQGSQKALPRCQRGAQASLSGAEETRTEECQYGIMPSAFRGMSVMFRISMGLNQSCQ